MLECGVCRSVKDGDHHRVVARVCICDVLQLDAGGGHVIQTASKGRQREEGAIDCPRYALSGKALPLEIPLDILHYLSVCCGKVPWKRHGVSHACVQLSAIFEISGPNERVAI